MDMRKDDYTQSTFSNVGLGAVAVSNLKRVVKNYKWTELGKNLYWEFRNTDGSQINNEDLVKLRYVIDVSLI
jgi:predicted transcriptional regulator with HTH domain